MIFTILLIGLCLSALVQSNSARGRIAWCYAGAVALHIFIFSAYEGWLYYGSAAVLALMVIMVIALADTNRRMVKNLHLICLVSILLNFIGWVMWVTYLPPFIYNVLFMLLYCAAIAAILREELDVGDTTGAWRYSGFLGHTNKRHHDCNTL